MEEGKSAQADGDAAFSKALPEKTHKSRFMTAIGSRSGSFSNQPRPNLSQIIGDANTPGTSPTNRMEVPSSPESVEDEIYSNENSADSAEDSDPDSPGTTRKNVDAALLETRRASSGSLKTRNSEKREERLRNLRKFSTSCPQLPRHLLMLQMEQKEADATEEDKEALSPDKSRKSKLLFRSSSLIPVTVFCTFPTPSACLMFRNHITESIGMSLRSLLRNSMNAISAVTATSPKEFIEQLRDVDALSNETTTSLRQMIEKVCPNSCTLKYSLVVR